jgi:ribonuclease Z
LCFVLCKIDNQVGQPETALRGKKHKKFPMPKLTLLGTGTPTPLPHRAGSGYLVRLDREMLMVDCGPGCGRRLLEAGVSPTQITSLLLTHLHYDHCVDCGYLVLSRWDQGCGKSG